jgi:hypothetical protein
MPEKTHYHQNKNRNAGAGGAVYGLGMIGAWIFYIGHATTFWIGVLGVLKGHRLAGVRGLRAAELPASVAACASALASSINIPAWQVGIRREWFRCHKKAEAPQWGFGLLLLPGPN